MATEPGITALRIVCPSTVAVGEQFSFGLKLLTDPYVVGFSCRGDEKYNLSRRYNLSDSGTSDMQYLDNVPRGWRGAISIEADGGGYEGPSAHTLGGERPCVRIGPASFTKPGLKFLTVHDQESDLAATGNPVLVSAEPLEQRLFWGDLHCHTWLSDGLRSPEQVCAFARDEAFLDIFAIADHNRGPTPRQWDYCVGISNDFNEPGRFVTLIGQEWGGSRSPGHLNVYYPGDTGSELSHQFAGDYAAFLQDARKHKALVIHHHSATAFFKKDWGEEYDPQLHRLVEIYSIWGDSERPERDGNLRPIRALGGERDGQHVLDALRRGYRMGFIGGSDCHDGRPGDELHTHQEQMREFDYHKLHRQGLMGVWAPELTRDAVFKALYDRHVYATTNERLILKFSINGHPMGSEIAAHGELSIRTEAYSDVPISRAELVRAGQEFQTLDAGEREVVWEISDVAESREPTWYYVRLTREDGERAWSSPIWVSGPE